MDNVVNKSNDQGITQMTHSWIMEINEQRSKVENISEAKPLMNKKNAIYRRPVNVSEKQDSTFDYTPRIVSFGPYHHDDKSCQQTNEIKKCALIRFLERSEKQMDDYVKAIIEVVEDLKDAYNQLDPKWQHDDDAFLQLMIYDGCFLLEILREAESLDAQNHLVSRQIRAMYGINPNELIEYYKHDMLLLENLLPMMLLLKLVAVQSDLSIQAAEKDLYKQILKFIAPSSLNITEKMLKEGREGMYLHVLDLYRSSLLYKEDIRAGSRILNYILDKIQDLMLGELPRGATCIRMILYFLMFLFYLPILAIIAIVYCPLQFLKYFFWTKPPSDIHFIIPSATELDKVGIKMISTKSLWEIRYGLGKLWLPQIYVNGATQSRFLNIIAFEQLHADGGNVVTSYIYFMSRLLQVAADVRLLQVRCIIFTSLQNHEVVELFKSVSKDIVHDPNIFFTGNYLYVGKRLTESFYIKMNNAWQRDLWQTYLKSPWAVISVVAAFFLFALTIIQTVYTVLGYHNPK